MLDIDMENYGRSYNDPAAVDQVVDTNSYQEGAEEYEVRKELLDQPELVDEKLEEPRINPQAEHFRQLREEVDRIKAEREADKREHQLQLEMLRANSNRQQEYKPPAPQKKAFEGMQDDDVPSVAEIRKEWSHLENERKQQESNYQARLEELQVQQMYPDYAEVIEKFALPLVKQKPHIAEGIQGASNKALMAYEIGKMAQQMQQAQAQAQPPVRSESAKRIVENSKKPGTLSQAGGQAALSQADYFASMSDKEFIKFASKNLESI